MFKIIANIANIVTLGALNRLSNNELQSTNPSDSRTIGAQITAIISVILSMIIGVDNTELQTMITPVIAGVSSIYGLWRHARTKRKTNVYS